MLTMIFFVVVALLDIPAGGASSTGFHQPEAAEAGMRDLGCKYELYSPVDVFSYSRKTVSLHGMRCAPLRNPPKPGPQSSSGQQRGVSGSSSLNIRISILRCSFMQRLADSCQRYRDVITEKKWRMVGCCSKPPSTAVLALNRREEAITWTPRAIERTLWVCKSRLTVKVRRVKF